MRLNKYDQVWVQLALLAVKTTGSKVKGTKGYWNQRLRNFNVTGKLEHKNMPIPTKYVPPKITCKDDLHAQHAATLTEWHLAKGNVAKLRVQHLEDLIHFIVSVEILRINCSDTNLALGRSLQSA